MFMGVIVASGDEDFHNMIVTRTYRRDDTLNAIDDDDGADLAHITSATSSYRQRNTTSGTLTATLRASIDRAGRSSNDNYGPRQQTKLARTNGSALILSAPGDEILASIKTVRSQASPNLHHIVVHIMDGCALGAPAAGILIAPRCCVNNTKALRDDRCFGQRRGKAISIDNPMGSGRHFDLEVKMSKPASQPRSLALMTHTLKALPAGRYGITRRYPLGRTTTLFMQLFAYLLLSRATLLCCCSSGFLASARWFPTTGTAPQVGPPSYSASFSQ